jgi:hypothetical protein
MGATPLSESDEPTLRVRLPPDIYKALAEIAKEHERSVAGEVRWLIRQLAEEAGLM